MSDLSKKRKDTREGGANSPKQTQKKVKIEKGPTKKFIEEKKSKGIELKISHNKLIPPKIINWEFFKTSDYPLNEWFMA